MWDRCKSSKQLEDPRLTAAAAAAVAEAEAEERALAAALEAISRLPPRPDHGPRRSLCVEVGLLVRRIKPIFIDICNRNDYKLAVIPYNPRLRWIIGVIILFNYIESIFFAFHDKSEDRSFFMPASLLYFASGRENIFRYNLKNIRTYVRFLRYKISQVTGYFGDLFSR